MNVFERVLHIIGRTARYGLGLAVEELPERIRFEIQRHQDLDTRVREYYPWDAPCRYMWQCPDQNYGWHYDVDDLGIYGTWDEAHEAGLQHWRDYHEGRWPGE